jgi:hypothetical protein
MLRKSAFVFALFAVCAGVGPASSQSLRDLRAQDADNAALAREASYTSEVCGRPISARIDWAASRNWPADESLAAACDGSLGAVEAVCRAGRKNLVRSFVCAGDGTGPELSGGVLRYGASPDENGFEETRALLDGAG